MISRRRLLCGVAACVAAPLVSQLTKPAIVLTVEGVFPFAQPLEGFDADEIFSSEEATLADIQALYIAVSRAAHVPLRLLTPPKLTKS